MCHGENGSLYRSDLAKGMTEAKLEARLVEMTDGQARSPLGNKELDVLAAWFRAFLKKEPFVAWTSTNGSKLNFETSAGATLTATASGKSVAVTQSRGLWTLTLPSGASASSVVVTAKSGDKKIELKLAGASTSHTSPLK
jgi:hypothetical protein